VGRHDDEHLRRFLAARRDGDAVEMRRCWEELVISVYDRMDNIVAATHRGRLDDDEHETAVELALARFSTRLIHTFAGTSMGELVNATKTLARGICIDVQRRSIRERTGNRSLDAGWEADAAERPSTAWEADEAVARFERDQQDADAEAFLAWGLPQLRGRRREVVELTFYGAELPEICDELGLSRDNAYQLRSRGLKDLAKLKEAYES
jgi:hypothetical protein